MKGNNGMALVLVAALSALAGCVGDVKDPTAPSSGTVRIGGLASVAALNDKSCGTPPSPNGSYFQLVAQPSSQEGTVRSLSGVTPVEVQFTNATCSSVRVYWLDYQGVRVLYTTLAPHTSYVQQTWLTHPWVIADESDRALMIFLPDPAASGRMEAYITASNVSYPLPPAPPGTPKKGPRSFTGPDYMTVCSWVHPPAGYIATATDIAAFHCGPDVPLHARFDVVYWRYVDQPVGTRQSVCAFEDTPAGWIATPSPFNNPAICWIPFSAAPRGAVEITRVF